MGVIVHPAVASGSQHMESWQSLDSQYGLDDTFDEPGVTVAQTVEEEYMSYMSVPLSTKGTELFSFWQVSFCKGDLIVRLVREFPQVNIK
jgi:hypothetical protein